jgi:hypothetical protein
LCKQTIYSSNIRGRDGPGDNYVNKILYFVHRTARAPRSGRAKGMQWTRFEFAPVTGHHFAELAQLSCYSNSK